MCILLTEAGYTMWLTVEANQQQQKRAIYLFVTGPTFYKDLITETKTYIFQSRLNTFILNEDNPSIKYLFNWSSWNPTAKPTGRLKVTPCIFISVRTVLQAYLQMSKQPKH